MAQDPSPWSIVLDYSKTVITVATGLLTFTGTFSSKLYDGADPPGSLIAAWVLLLLSMAFCLYAIGRLTGYLIQKENNSESSERNPSPSVLKLLRALVSFKQETPAEPPKTPNSTSVLLLSNLAYFSLFLAAGFFVYLITFSSPVAGKTSPSLPDKPPVTEHNKDLLESRTFVIRGFPDGDDKLPDTQEGVSLIEYVQAHSMEIASCLIIGSTDKRPLRGIAKKRFVSNITLASSRGRKVLEFVVGNVAFPADRCLIVSSGGRGTDDYSASELEKVFYEDRAVYVRLTRLKQSGT
ncbi:MAG: hypothetical protein CV088_18600 [Nitrospira sp. LK70]|nr:hypothetical protein [Nitrospira sp. LK70]